MEVYAIWIGYSTTLDEAPTGPHLAMLVIIIAINQHGDANSDVKICFNAKFKAKVY